MTFQNEANGAPAKQTPTAHYSLSTLTVRVAHHSSTNSVSSSVNVPSSSVAR